MSLSQTGTKGGEPFGKTTEKPAQQEGSETVHQGKRKTHHPSGSNLLRPPGTENQEYHPQGHSE